MTRLLMLSLAVAALAVAAVASGHTAHAARACSSSNLPNHEGYFTTLHVTHVSCATGKKVEKAHYKCRRANGKKGRCHHKVLGYKCKEVKRVSSSVELDGRVVCKKGSRKVVYTYQQNL